jgi:Mg/Co/Ni transporter MgtE
MDPRVLHLQPAIPVADALDLIRVQQFHKRPTQARRILLLLDADRHIEGMVAIQDLVMALPTELLLDYMQRVPAGGHRAAGRTRCHCAQRCRR